MRAFLGMIWMVIALTGFIIQYRVTGSILGGLVGVVVVNSVMFVGMVMAFCDASNRDRNKVKDAIALERRMWQKASLGMAKAVADRVSNRIVSKYVTGMDDDQLRESVLEGVEQVVKEEVDGLSKAVGDECDSGD